MTVNEALLDRAVMRAIYLERFENREVAQVVGFINTEVLPEVQVIAMRSATKSVGSRPGRGGFSVQRSKELGKALRKVTTPLFAQLYLQLRNDLQALAVEEVRWQNSAIQTELPIVFATTIPNVASLHAAVTDSPFEGRILKDWSRSLDAQLRVDLQTEVAKGLTNGETMVQIERRLTGLASQKGKGGVFGKARRSAEAVARTAVIHSSNAARDRYYEQNTSLIKGVQWVATLDGNTCPTCGALDGKVWPAGEGDRPPDHHRCRCTTVPVLKSYRELGLNIDEIPPSTRASMDGQVSEKLNFEGWLKTKSKGLQNDVLGKTKASMWRQGDIKLSSFRGSNGRLLTIEELELLG